MIPGMTISDMPRTDKSARVHIGHDCDVIGVTTVDLEDDNVVKRSTTLSSVPVTYRISMTDTYLHISCTTQTMISNDKRLIRQERDTCR